ncbi:methionine ABC transporter ATP-binding protein [Pueribacillus theae]|uniref:Methionine ABC transporter ATP-binding protein n=1 Tax=Pueribacillus theae TaxID=2171751 RepID=A0A2U1JPD6_9BACI|nr:methionine ABC transporter ATP-binding protein [Pueribacillus theae]PWA07050.1 methionine ABC transporter ATP-binding protein [Pueribacillus theae]
MIELKNITKVYKRKNTSITALKNVDLKIEKGEIFGVIGYSGAGKSTLIRLVNYLEKPTEGQVIIEGTDLSSYTTNQLREKKKDIGMIFQHFNLLESKTVFDNVALPLVLSKRKKQEINERVNELLSFVGLEDKAKNYPNELSGGQKQRVGIARALASNPSILLCDEATSALDPQTTDSILNLLKKINEEYNITMLIITHEMDVVKQICHKVAVMEKGEIIEQGPVIELFGNPQHPTTKSFVRTVIKNEIPNRVKQAIKTGENHRLLRLDFMNQSTSEPVINEMIESIGVKINILYANTTEIQEALLVTMIVQLEAEALQLDEAVRFLEKNHVVVKEVRSS